MRRASRCRARSRRGCCADLDPVAGRQGPPADGQGGHQGRQRPHDELDDRARARRRRGRSSSSPTSSRPRRSRGWSTSCCTCCGSTRTTRSPSGARAPTRSWPAPTRLTERRFDALHYEGPGTDLDDRAAAARRAGRPPASRPSTGSSTCRTCRRRRSSPRPDPERTEGTVTSTKPLVLIDGTVVRDLVVRFEGGPRRRDLRVGGRRDAAHDHPRPTRARRGWASARWSTARAASGSWARSSTTRCSTRTPPATSRSGQGFPFVLGEDDRDRANKSEIHIDFMIGSERADRHRDHRERRARARPGGGSLADLTRLPFRLSRRGAGAAERARLEIV